MTAKLARPVFVPPDWIGSRHRSCKAPGLCLFLLGVLLCVAPKAAAQAYRAERITAAAPPELASAVRETLTGEALRVVGPEGLLCELWLRKAVPAKTSAVPEMGISYGQFAEGTLVGAVRFPAEVKDYRRQRVKPGVYTLRYALIPVDGNHLGVAPQRDFLLLAPATADVSPANVTRDEALNLSRKTTGTQHPSVWSLATVEGEPAPLPVVTHREEADLWVLHCRVQIQLGDGAPSPLLIALVVVGQAPEA